MFKHKKSILTLLLAAAVFLAGSALTEVLAEEMPVLLSLEELAEFNGKDGKPAYVAVDGILYDMTASRAWGSGNHNGFEAGNDLTKEIKEVSPHGVGKLENVIEIGRIIQELTVEQLSEFNGKDGKPAYIAVDGVIYDVTESSAWEGGGHKDLEAGLDLTAQFKDSPHDVSTLDKINKIGILIP